MATLSPEHQNETADCNSFPFRNADIVGEGVGFVVVGIVEGIPVVGCSVGLLVTVGEFVGAVGFVVGWLVGYEVGNKHAG